MIVPFLDLSHQHKALREKLLLAIAEVMDSNTLVLGNFTTRFEQNFAQMCLSQYAVGLSSGLDALVIALKTLGVGPGDEVIVPAHTFIATWLAVTHIGAVPVPVEPDPITFNIGARQIAPRIGPKTKAVIPVHMYGQCCAMDEIMELARLHQLYVVEDCAQAHGALWKGKPAGSFGHCNAFSFYPVKNLGAIGEAGAICTQSAEWATKASALRHYGQYARYINEEIGYNSRMDEMQAAILCVKMEYLHQWNAQRSDAASFYQMALKGLPGLTLPFQMAEADHVWHLYVVRHPLRDQLQAWLQHRGIGTIIHYPIPPHLQKAYAFARFRKGDFPLSEEIANTALSLPLYPGISPQQQQLVVNAVQEFCLNYSPL